MPMGLILDCPYCSRYFESWAALQFHVEQSHTEKPAPSPAQVNTVEEAWAEYFAQKH